MKGVEEVPQKIDPSTLKVRETTTAKGPRYQVVSENGNWTNPIPGETKRYKTREAAEQALNRIKASNTVEGANPLQTFADGTPKEKWATSKARTNTFEYIPKLNRMQMLWLEDRVIRILFTRILMMLLTLRPL